MLRFYMDLHYEQLISNPKAGKMFV